VCAAGWRMFGWESEVGKKGMVGGKERTGLQNESTRQKDLERCIIISVVSVVWISLSFVCFRACVDTLYGIESPC
jgi:hypothetical protein